MNKDLWEALENFRDHLLSQNLSAASADTEKSGTGPVPPVAGEIPCNQHSAADPPAPAPGDTNGLVGEINWAIDHVRYDGRIQLTLRRARDKIVRLTQENGTWRKANQEQLAKQEALERDLAQARADAERYRWLRECSMARSDRMMYVSRNNYDNGRYLNTDYPEREELDAYIDARRAAGERSGG